MEKTLKYFIALEGKNYIIANSTKEMKEIIKNHAKDLLNRNCENVDIWYDEMRFYHYSRIYNDFSDFILPLNKKDIKYLKEMLDK